MKEISILDCLEATGGELILGDSKTKIQKITKNRISLSKGSLLILIGRTIKNEEEMINNLVKNSSVGIVLSKRQKLNLENWMGTNLNVITVNKVEEAYFNLATLYRKQFNIPIIEVVGSSGKTTTKEMIGKIVKRKMQAIMSDYNYNSPLAVANYISFLRERHQAGIYEVGMSQRGHIKRSSTMLSPSIGVITSLHRAHLQKLGSIEEIIEAKSEILDCMSENSTLVINHEDENCKKMPLERYKGKCLWYGFTDECDIWADTIYYEGLSTIFTVHGENYSFTCKINTFGKYNVLNALAAIAVAKLLGIEEEDIITGLVKYMPNEGRQEVKVLDNDIIVINDNFNANPDSTSKLMDEIPELIKQRPVFLLLGDMENPNSDPTYSRQVHYQIGKQISSQTITTIVCIGKWAKEYLNGAIDGGFDETKIHYFENVNDAKPLIKNYIKPNSYVILKASKYVNLRSLISSLV